MYWVITLTFCDVGDKEIEKGIEFIQQNSVKLQYDTMVTNIKEVQKETGVNERLIRKWVAIYVSDGIDGFKNKEHYRGNKFAALHISKSLTNEERLELENMKLKIENERLKKGYLVKGVGAEKEYVTFLEKNMQ